ncbi:MAG: hypothetical protein WA902_05215 [Thermosynechococcaceae cyanobacterium]
MTTGTATSAAEDYVVAGLAACFIKKDGKLEPVKVIEPIPSAALEAILKGIPTSYEMAVGTTYGAMLNGDEPQRPSQFPAYSQFCDEFTERLQATARSYATRPVATAHIAVGEIKTDFNFSLERKRTLNSERIVSTEDNVKQHSHTHKVL